MLEVGHDSSSLKGDVMILALAVTSILTSVVVSTIVGSGYPILVGFIMAMMLERIE